MTKEEIISALKECAATLGHAPTLREIRTHSSLSLRAVKKHFTCYTSALMEAGLERCGNGSRLTMLALFKDWAQVARKLKKVPTMSEFELHGKYSTIPYGSRFLSWRRVPRGMHAFAEKEGLAAEYADVLTIIREQYGTADQWGHRFPASAPGAAPTTTPTMRPTMTTSDTSGEEATWPAPIIRPILRPGTRPGMRRPIMPDRPVYGAPMLSMALCNVPVNEMGVVFLFGMLARELGFSITRIQSEYPDCEALRQMDNDRWQRIWIEFEFASRNFLEHQHDPEKCDLIVCWTNNWPECPIEVLELKSVMQEMGLVLPR